MKKLFVLAKVNILLIFIFVYFFANAQMQVTDTVTPEQMAENLTGSGIEILNVSYTGAEVARGLFYGADTSGFVMEEGIALTSGTLLNIPGPNISPGITTSLGLPGDPELTNLLASNTYDAAILELTFKPEGDSLFFNFAFASEEYNEWVNSSFVDGCGIFISGPNPVGGSYDLENIAWVPGTYLPVTVNNVNNGYAQVGSVPNGPCTNCEYYHDNTDGLITEFDGFTSIIDSSVLVYPDSVYQMKIVVADAYDAIFDSGIFLEENSLYCPATADFLSFEFDTINNPGLLYNVSGELYYDSIFISIPYIPDLTNLIATFSISPGATAYVGGLEQQSSVTPNDFTFPVTYTVIGENNYEKDWVVNVSVLPNHQNDILSFSFEDELNPQLSDDIVGILGDSTVDLYTPIGTDLSNLIATFVLSEEADAYVNGVLQQTTITANDFTNPVTYQVVAQNEDEKNWMVTVHLVTGQINEKIENISVYPIPVKDQIFINQAKGFDVSMVNGQGVQLFQKRITDNHFSFDVSNFEKGVYYLKFSSEQNWFVRKIIIGK